MTVVFINPWERRIGPNRYLAEMLTALPETASRSTVVFDRKYDSIDEYVEIGCRTDIWPEAKNARARISAANLFDMLATHTVGVIRIVQRLKKLKPAVVVTNGENCWAPAIASRLLHIRHIHVFHGIPGYRFNRKPQLVRLYVSLVAGMSDSIIAVSNTQAGHIEAAGIRKAKVNIIANPIRLPDQIGEPGAVFPEDAYPVILCAGQISPIKGQDLLIEALPEIVRAFPRAYCLLAGKVGSVEGVDDTIAFTNALRERVKELDMTGHVSLLGDVDSLFPLMKASDIYVQPSRMESFGRAAAEALLMGKPTAGFNVGGLMEITGGGAYLAPAGDTAALAEAVIDACTNTRNAQSLTQLGQRHVQSSYSAEALAPAFASLLQETRPAGTDKTV